MVIVNNNPEKRHEATRNHTLGSRRSLGGSSFPVVEYVTTGNGIKLIILAPNA